MARCSAKTHRSTRIPLYPARDRQGLILVWRRIAASSFRPATVSLIMGGPVRDVFGGATGLDRGTAFFRRSGSAGFFAGTVLFVFGAGMLATPAGAALSGLDRSIQFGLLVAASGSVAILLASIFDPTFLPFLCAVSVFVLGMGIVNPLGTAQARSPRSARKAGRGNPPCSASGR